MSINLFAKNAEFLRERDGLKFTETQASIGFPRSTWNGYERGTSFPNFKDLIKISEYFGVLESDLLHKTLTEAIITEAYHHFLIVRNDITPLSKSFKEYQSANIDTITPTVEGRILPQILPKSLPNQAAKGKYSPSNTNSFVNENSLNYGAKAPKIITVNDRGLDNILYVPIKARAGYLLGHGDPEFIDTLQTFRMPGLNNQTYRMFETEGLSMSPTLSDRDRVIGQWVNNFDEIRENRIHVLLTKDGVLIKRILNRIKERGKIYLKSDTITHRPDHPIIEMDPEDIQEIWYVNLKVSSDLSEPTEVYTRISDLELNQQLIMQKMGIQPMQLKQDPLNDV